MRLESELRQNINEQIIAALMKGTAPWRRPWSNDACQGSPKNAASGRSYSGVNVLLLSLAADGKKFDSRYWATYRQWQSLGGQVRAGAKSTTIVFSKPFTTTRLKDGVEVEETYWTLRSFAVFNVGDVLGDAVDRFRPGHSTVDSSTVFERCQQADDLIEATKADIRYGGNQAFYCPAADYIQMPQRRQFAGPEWYETIFHELAHWSEHESRLNWNRSVPQHTYELGELIAELASCYVAGELGLPVQQSLDNHVAYLQHWIERMKGDPRFIFKATSQASKVASFLLSFGMPAVEFDDENAVLIAQE